MSGRKMVYPYTAFAKVALFPYKFYYDNAPFFKFTLWAFVACLPIFYKIQKQACADVNYVAYAKYQKKEREEYEHHNEHLD